MNCLFRYKPRSFYSLLSFNGLRAKEFHLSCGKFVRKVTKRSETVNHNSGGESRLYPVSDSFNNFYGIESEEDVIHFEGKTSKSGQNYDYDFNDVYDTNNTEKIINVRFGSVRLDSDNKPQFHGQFDPRESTDGDISSFQDDQHWFENNVSKDLPENKKMHNQSSFYNIGSIKFNESNVENSIPKAKQDASVADNQKDSFIDEVYFPGESLPETNINKSNIKIKSENYDSIIKESFTGINSKISDSSITSSSSHLDDNVVQDNKPKKFNESNIIEDQYFNNNSSTYNGADKMKSFNSNGREQGSNFFDEQYFEDLMGKDLNFKQDSFIGIESSPSSETLSEKSSISFQKEVLEEKYVTNVQSNQVKKTGAPTEFSQSQMSENAKVFTEQNSKITSTSNNIPFTSKDSMPKSLEMEFFPDKVTIPKFTKDVTTNEVQTSIKKELPNLDSKKPNSKMEFVQNVNKNRDQNCTEETETAFDYVKKLRSERKIFPPKIKGGKILPTEQKLDYKGFRILSYQVPNLSHFTREEIMTVLKNSVLYSDDDIIVLNKPYNMVMHDSQTTSDPCISQYLDELANELDHENESPKLITVHRLDKETCGCLLLARNEKAAQNLLTLFAQRKIIKTYWIVTIDVPDPLEGVIDIPIAEGKVENRARMVLHPDLPKDLNYENHSKRGKRAVTSYKTIATSGNAALVEVQPETGIKHQIRVHFGFGLSCPILGDHKYSHLSKMAPQKLPSDMLQRLRVRQSKVRHIPMHIYARSILIPQYSEGRNLFVQAPMPTHMSINLQWLKFKKN